MNPVVEAHRLPPASLFVSAMWDKVLDAYPQVMSVVSIAIAQAGGDREAVDRMVGNEASPAAFLMGCCVEELASSGFVTRGDEARHYIEEMIAALSPPGASEQEQPGCSRFPATVDGIRQPSGPAARERRSSTCWR